jgi:hypothetical protein
MIDPLIENKINSFLQKKVSLFIEGSKPMKEGKFLIFKFKEFYLNFTIKHNTASKTIELPYPFKITEGDNCLKFSYNIEEFAAENEDLQFKLLLCKPEKKNKLYNSVVVLSAIEL